MSPFWGHLTGILTLIVMILFIAIWAWAWLPQHKPKFDELSKLPLEDREDER